MRQTVQEWLRYVLNHYARHTYKLYKHVLCRFLDGLPSDIALNSVTPEHIERYLQYLNCSNASKNAHLIAIKSLYHFLGDRYGIENAAKSIKRLKCTHKRRFLSEAEYQKALNACRNQKESSLLQFLANTGLRIGEIKLAESNVHDGLIRVLGKGQKERTVPLNATAKTALAYLLLSKSVPPSTADNICKRTAERAGIESYSCHALRRLFANRLRRNGVDIFLISKILGHSNILITQIYLSCETGELKGLTDFMDNPPVERC